VVADLCVKVEHARVPDRAGRRIGPVRPPGDPGNRVA
jgi:hypothetical protein